MPSCRLVRHVIINGQSVPLYRFGILLQEGERFAIYCPADDNELVKGATRAFIDSEIARGRLEVQ